MLPCERWTLMTNGQRDVFYGSSRDCGVGFVVVASAPCISWRGLSAKIHGPIDRTLIRRVLLTTKALVS